jgi:hypothetical protein
MPKPRIRENFRLWKSKINNYLNDKKVIIINDLETEFVKQNLISVNFDEYISKKKNRKNIIYSVILSTFCTFWTLKLIYAAFVKDAYILKLIGDPYHSIGDQMISNICFAIFVLIALKVRLIYISSKFFSFNDEIWTQYLQNCI